MKRTKLCDRILPCYCKGEEVMNMVTHITGGALALLGAVVLLLHAHGITQILCAIVYALSMVGV